MLAFISYVIAVGLLLGLAALALERSARSWRMPTRWLWGSSMMASLLLPLLMPSVSVRIPRVLDVVAHAIPDRVVALQRIAATSLSPSDWLTMTARLSPATPDLDLLLQVGWSAASGLLLLVILAGSAELSWRRRHWERGHMAGVAVHISEDAGPAVVGVLDPQIVVPRWLMQCPPGVQKLVIAHEQSHLEVHDTRLVTLALGLLVCMPWNLPLWWQLRRLRMAVEMDCDARVLRRGHDVSGYGEILIAVGERQSNMAMVAAMAGSRSLLERRIRNMLRRQTRYAHATAAALACLGMACAVGATEISPPNGDASARSASQEVTVDARILDGYVGFYQLNDQAVMTIARDGEQLNAHMIAHRPVPLYPRSNTEFSYKDGQISFITEPDGQTTSLILHKYGVIMPMKRIDAAAAQRIFSIGPERDYQPKPNWGGALIILQ
jgi:bla regulator protein BlaR1